MNILRRLPTTQLLGLLAAVAVGAGAIAAVAVAAIGGGPLPPHKTLANAIHDGLAAAPVNGVTARIAFTNTLLPSADFEGHSPLLNGASGRLWASDDGRLRLELQSSRGDTQLVVDRRANSFWLYDQTSGTVYRGTLPAGAHGADTPAADTKDAKHALPTIAEIQSALTRLMAHVNVSGATPTNVGGEPAYSVRLSPSQPGGLIGAAELAWSATHGVPLRVGLYTRGSSTPVLELTATSISFGAVPASDLAVAPPAGAKVVNVDTSTGKPGAPDKAGATDNPGAPTTRPKPIQGLAAVSAALPFALSAPDQLANLKRTSVSEVTFAGEPTAIVRYGEGLGSIIVVERPAHHGGAASPTVGAAPDAGHGGKGLGGLSLSSLPTVTINGVKSAELATAIGTLERFERGGVSYTVLGSVTASDAEAAARGL